MFHDLHNDDTERESNMHNAEHNLKAIVHPAHIIDCALSEEIKSSWPRIQRQKRCKALNLS